MLGSRKGNRIMKILRSIAVAFSLYSRVPMPMFEWKDEDLKYNLIFLPWIGILIGAMEYGLLKLIMYMRLPLLAMVALVSAVPIIITGGFHIDGFMDVMDALKSYKSKDEKLAILKDPHIGAFSVISLVLYIALMGVTQTSETLVYEVNADVMII